MGWRSPYARQSAVAVLLSLAFSVAAMAVETPGWEASIADAAMLRRTGHLHDAARILASAAANTTSPRALAHLTGELGATLLQARRLDEAQLHLQTAIQSLEGEERARYGLFLGNLFSVRKQEEAARTAYEGVMAAAHPDTELWFAAATNLTRHLPASARLPHLARMTERLESSNLTNRARIRLNIGDQARGLGAPATDLAYSQLAKSRVEAVRSGDPRLALESEDSLAQLYEDQGRSADAFLISRRGLAASNPLDEPLLADVQASLQWRIARHHASAGQPELAKAALSRAVQLIRSVRSDMPIEYEDGTSSYRRTLEPIYLAYAGALLRAADEQGGKNALALVQVIEVVEELKQAELQDYLGDRCAVEIVQGGAHAAVPPGVAAVYTLVFSDRVELLLLVAGTIERHTVAVRGESVRSMAASFAQDLRQGSPDYARGGRQLHEWLIRPLQASLRQHKVHSLVIVPDSSLRLLPFGALMEGSRFVLESYAVSTVTGLSITNASPPSSRSFSSLVVGISEPGPVLDKLLETSQGIALLASAAPALQVKGGSPSGRRLRTLADSPLARGAASPAADPLHAQEALRDLLRLPGVAREVTELRGILPGKTLLNAQFTLKEFAREAETGKYRILHIASHGVFGGTAESSFILAFDDLLTMDSFETLLKSESITNHPIELLALSACETAEGNDRAPLGFSGIAVKARAKAVLGSLWPVDDDGAQRLMNDLYRGVVRQGLSKTEALRRAQLALLRDPGTNHPMFWAPFLLIGNWS